MTNELLEFEGGLLGLALNLDVREIGVVLLGDFVLHRGGAAGQADGRGPLGARRRRLPGPGGGPAGHTRSTASARSRPRRRRALELQAPASSSASR